MTQSGIATASAQGVNHDCKEAMSFGRTVLVY